MDYVGWAFNSTYKSVDIISNFLANKSGADSDVLGFHQPLFQSASGGYVAAPGNPTIAWSLLNLPTDADIVTQQRKKRRWDAWFDCTHIPKITSLSLISLPSNPGITKNQAWSAIASGFDVATALKTGSVSQLDSARYAATLVESEPSVKLVIESDKNLFSVIKAHEVEHAKHWRRALLGVSEKWVEKYAERTDPANAVSAGSEAKARAKLWRKIGGTSEKMVKKIYRESDRGTTAVHRSPALNVKHEHVSVNPGSPPTVTVRVGPLG